MQDSGIDNEQQTRVSVQLSNKFFVQKQRASLFSSELVVRECKQGGVRDLERPDCSMLGVASTTQGPTPSKSRGRPSCLTCLNLKGLALCSTHTV